MNGEEFVERYTKKIKVLDDSWRAKTLDYLKKLAIPEKGLGDLNDLAIQLVAAAKKLTPKLNSKCIIVMAADHGIVDENVSRLPRVTDSIVRTMLNGGGAINILSKDAGCDLKVVDMGIDGNLKSCVSNDNFISKYINKKGTNNFLHAAAMSEEQCLQALKIGIEIAEGLSHRYDIFGVGDAGIGNTTSAAAISAALLNLPPEKVTGIGSGTGAEHLQHKCRIVAKALDFHQLDNNSSTLVLLWQLTQKCSLAVNFSKYSV